MIFQKTRRLFACKELTDCKAASTSTYDVRGQSAYTVGRQCARTVRGQIAYDVLCPHLLGVSSQSSHVVEWSCSWNVCSIYIFNEKKEAVKICETFLDAALVQPSWFLRWRPSLLGCCNFFMFCPKLTFEIADFFSTSVVLISYFFLQENPSHHLFYYGFCSRHSAHPINMH
jgi:hypothetical protein